VSKTPTREVMIAKRPFRLRRDAVERAMRGILPEPISSHFVVVGNRRYPPKQVIGELTGLDRADFTTHQARRVLMNLGFQVGRRPAAGPTPGRAQSTRGDDGLAAALRSLVGQWVATKGDEVLVAASSPQAVVSWLAQHHQRAESMFRVPEDDAAGSGLAPL
jgi:hypothetical protein